MPVSFLHSSFVSTRESFVNKPSTAAAMEVPMNIIFKFSVKIVFQAGAPRGRVEMTGLAQRTN